MELRRLVQVLQAPVEFVHTACLPDFVWLVGVSSFLVLSDGIKLSDSYAY